MDIHTIAAAAIALDSCYDEHDIAVAIVAAHDAARIILTATYRSGKGGRTFEHTAATIAAAVRNDGTVEWSDIRDVAAIMTGSSRSEWELGEALEGHGLTVSVDFDEYDDEPVGHVYA